MVWVSEPRELEVETILCPVLFVPVPAVREIVAELRACLSADSTLARVKGVVIERLVGALQKHRLAHAIDGPTEYRVKLASERRNQTLAATLL